MVRDTSRNLDIDLSAHNFGTSASALAPYLHLWDRLGNGLYNFRLQSLVHCIRYYISSSFAYKKLIISYLVGVIDTASQQGVFPPHPGHAVSQPEISECLATYVEFFVLVNQAALLDTRRCIRREHQCIWKCAVRTRYPITSTISPSPSFRPPMTFFSSWKTWTIFAGISSSPPTTYFKREPRTLIGDYSFWEAKSK